MNDQVELEMWRDALEDPAITAEPDRIALLAAAQAAMTAHPTVTRHGREEEGEPLDREVLSRVADFIGRMTGNPLGQYFLRTSTVRSLRNYIVHRGNEYPRVRQIFFHRLVHSCFHGVNDRYTGDGYVELALVMHGLADPNDSATWARDFKLGPTAEAAAAWESCVDWSWVTATPAAPWLRPPARAEGLLSLQALSVQAAAGLFTAQNVAAEGYPADVVSALSAAESLEAWRAAATRRTDGVSICSAGGYSGCVLRDDVHRAACLPQRPDAATVLEHVLTLRPVYATEVAGLAAALGTDPRIIHALKDSARIIAPHASHSLANAFGENATPYVRNYIMVEREHGHTDTQGAPPPPKRAPGQGGARGGASVSVASSLPGSAALAPQRTLLKLLLPPGDEPTSQLDARSSHLWSSFSVPSLVDQFYDGPWQNSRHGLVLVLVMQCAQASPEEEVTSLYFEKSLIVAILQADETPFPALLYVADPLCSPDGPGNAAAHEFITRAFLDCPTFQAYCAFWSKPPAVVIAGRGA